MTDRHWRQQAACAEVGPDLFIGDSGLGDPFGVRSVCKGCPVVEACLEYALETRALGVWGGTTSQQRWNMRARERSRVARTQ